MIQNILFDFDGVIADSMHVRDMGFREIFKAYDKELVDQLIDYNNLNGGLSRYVKIRYFYEELLGQNITEDKVLELAEEFSRIMKKELVNPSIIIRETRDFLERIHNDIPLHIVSGSDGRELNYLCQSLGLDRYFITIEGSPTHKNELVAGILKKYAYPSDATILIGDSINDHEAASVNGIGFFGYNNPDLVGKGSGYIESFSSVPFAIAD